MTATTERNDALVAATVPYALTALGTHMLDHQLPSPLDVEVPGRGGRFITIWLRPEDAETWSTTGINIDATSHQDRDGRTRHQAYGVLHGSCIRVRLIWHTDSVLVHADAFHVDCDGDEEGTGHVTLCLDEQQPCPDATTVKRACPHGLDLCNGCLGACRECRTEARTAGWLR